MFLPSGSKNSESILIHAGAWCNSLNSTQQTMKNVLFIFAIVMSNCLVACGQSKTDAPAAIKEAFAKKFSEVKKVSWEMEDEATWESEFKLKGTEYSANFLTDGTWVETEHELKKSELPSSILDLLSSEYKGYKVEEIESVETPDSKLIEVIVEKGEEQWELIFDSNGKFLEKKVVTEEDED